MDCVEYWKQAVQDYVECLTEPVDLTDKELDWVVNKLLNDEEMWQAIDNAIWWYITRLKNEK